MSEFTPITSQEALDAVLKERLNRQSEKHSKEMEALKTQLTELEEMRSGKEGLEATISELTQKVTSLTEELTGKNSEIADREMKIKELETIQTKSLIANEFGLSPEAVDFLRGDTEEDIRQSAERLSKITPKVVAPLAGAEPPIGDEKTRELKQMLANLNLGGN